MNRNIDKKKSSILALDAVNKICHSVKTVNEYSNSKSANY